MMNENSVMPRVVKIKSTTQIHDDLEAFDMIARFLASEKAKQLSHDFAGQAYLASSSQIWNDLRQACNSLLERNDPRREPVAAWKEQVEQLADSVLEEDSTTPVKAEVDEPSPKTAIKSELNAKEGSEKKSKKKRKRDIDNDDDEDDSTGKDDESSSARKRRKAEKKAKKAAKKAKKEKKSAKKAKKETS